jgi:hypothetical protein
LLSGAISFTYSKYKWVPVKEKDTSMPLTSDDATSIVAAKPVSPSILIEQAVTGAGSLAKG